MLDHIEDASGLHLQVVLPMSGYPTQFKSRLNFAHLQVWATKPEGVDPNHARFSSVSDWELRIAQESSEAARKYHVTITVALKEPSMDPDHAAWKHSYEGEAANTTTVLPEVRSGGKEIFPYSEAHQAVADFLESKAHTNFDVMALQASHIAFEALARSKTRFRPQRLRIRVKERVLAIPGKASAAIMKSWHFEGRQHKKYRNVQEDVKLEPGSQQAVVALGSNVGNRIGMIEEACNEMTRRGLEILQTSSLYETEAMYKTDQRSFVNGVCKIRTTLPPIDLLDLLKDIENSLGRMKTAENGPRTIDLDILLYDDLMVDHERLQIPHPRISEREFVLKPLCDIMPDSLLPQPNTLLDFSSQLANLPPNPTPLSPQTPLTRFTPLPTSPDSSPSDDTPNPLITTSLPTRKTHLMAILNLTPDSFSHDGVHTPTFSPTSLLPTLASLLAHSVTILDIGGESTRPHATPLSATDELARVLPTIKFIRARPEFASLLLCIDTYHASVARACIAAGADIINDVSAGQLDKAMLPTIAELGCTYIMMHMRGTPETMNTLTSYPAGVIEGIASELDRRVQEAMAAGIRRWRIVLDPGIGFAKTAEQNLEVLRRLRELRAAEGLRGLPWCVGVSRKGFVGTVTGAQEVGERVWGTAGAVTACVAGGADVVRVHDWREMGKVVRMGDAVWRV